MGVPWVGGGKGYFLTLVFGFFQRLRFVCGNFILVFFSFLKCFSRIYSVFLVVVGFLISSFKDFDGAAYSVLPPDILVTFIPDSTSSYTPFVTVGCPPNFAGNERCSTGVLDNTATQLATESGLSLCYF